MRRRLSGESDTAAFEEMARRAGWLRTLEEDAKHHLCRGDTKVGEIAEVVGAVSGDAPEEASGAGTEDSMGMDVPQTFRTGAKRAGARVLIVDDNPDNRGLMRASLSREGYALFEAQVQALRCGADDYLAKPFNPKVLAARAAALFRRKAAA